MVYRDMRYYFNIMYLITSLPKSDNSPQDTQITRHIPTDPVFFSALDAETKIPDPEEEKIISVTEISAAYPCKSVEYNINSTHPTSH